MCVSSCVDSRLGKVCVDWTVMTTDKSNEIITSGLWINYGGEKEQPIQSLERRGASTKLLSARRECHGWRRNNIVPTSAALGKVSIVEDVGFNYFTTGLGGSRVVNLYITNLGFGEPIVQ